MKYKNIFNFLKKIIILLIIFLFFWSFFIEPNQIEINQITIENEQLKDITIAIAGDFHLKKHEEKKLKNVINRINEYNPDLIFLIGDYVQGISELQSLPLDKITNNFRNLKSKNGIYAVLGNHDIWLGENKVTKALKAANIIILNNENKIINIKNRSITIAGTNDYTEDKADIGKSLTKVKKPIILLTHNPDIFPFVPEEIDLTISGHTHGGQVIIPYIGAPIVPSNYGNRYLKGLINENKKQILVTKGIGTSILPIRFNCKPEIIILSFK